MYRLKLELDGYSVDIAGDGLIALEKARTLHPDIIFLDIRLPKLDGLSVLEALRADPTTEHIPVVILSNWNEKELVERGAKLGALDHMIKSQTTPARLSQRLAGVVWLLIMWSSRSEEHTSELQSPCNLVCRLLLEKKKKNKLYCSNLLP